MALTRRSLVMVLTALLAAALVGLVAAASAQEDSAVSAGSDDALLERLDAIELALPIDAVPTAVNLGPATTWGTLIGDATSVRALLDTVEPDLRQLFVDADDAQGEVADAVALVAQGWLDVWTGSTALAAASAHDLAFPVEATDTLGASAGADELRGSIETGLELILQGRSRHLTGYLVLRDVGVADPGAQGRLNDRTEAAIRFDEVVRPDVVALLSQPSTGVMVPVERFVTDAPGVRSRATSMTVVCVDREALAQAGGVATDEVLEQLGEDDIQRGDCPVVTD